MIRLHFFVDQPAWIADFPGPSVKIGRCPPADIVRWSATVSRYHCELIEQGGALTIFDRNSTGGTPVNDERVQSRQLSPADVVGLHEWRFRAQVVVGPTPLTDSDRALLADPWADVPGLRAAIRRCPALAAALAGLPQAPPEALADLADHPARAVQQAVARHPATPAATLRRMAFYYAVEIEQNPSLPLHLLADPSFAAALQR